MTDSRRFRSETDLATRDGVLRETSDELCRAVVEQSRDCIFLVDLDTKRVIEGNGAFARLLGYRQSDLVRLTLFDFVAHDKPDIEEKIERIVEAKGHYLGERWYRCRDGTIVPVEVSVNMIRFGGREAMCVVSRDISDRKKAQEKLLAYQEQIRALASEVSKAEERERHRIASGLHDQTLQKLAACRLLLKRIAVRNDGTEDTRAAEEAYSILERVIQETRSLMFDLSPPELYEFGFAYAVDQLARKFSADHGVTCDLDLPEADLELNEEISIFLYRSVRELLANAGRYATGSPLSICIRRKRDKIRISVTDQGPGFKLSDTGTGKRPDLRSGFGLFDIRERTDLLGGRFEIATRPGRGSRITLTVPVGDDRHRLKAL